MPHKTLTTLAIALGLTACTLDTSGDGSPMSMADAAVEDTTPSGGASDSGGTAATGGMVATGGTPNSGGAVNTGAAEADGLSASEAEGLLFTREEEKLARDVYLALADWDMRFVNIAGSEQRHMDAVKTLLDAYGLGDPADGTAEGEFQNAELQDLHDQLVADGSASLEAAFVVGLTIEELDIRDIQLLIDETSAPDLIAVYENLLMGSRNHLRAFHAGLTGIGGTFTPQYITQQEYDAIANSAQERGMM